MKDDTIDTKKSIAISALYDLKNHLSNKSQKSINIRKDKLQKLINIGPKINQSGFINNDQESKIEQIRSLQYSIKTDLNFINNESFRNTPVFGDGNLASDIVFVGEAPGYEEEIQNKPFVGPSGQLLSKIISAMGLDRKQIYITNILKYRPKIGDGKQGHSNRKPTSDEIKISINYLFKELKIINPKIIIVLGGTAMEGLLNITDPISKVRGIIHSFNGTKAIVTYHPSFLLRSKNQISDKRKVWEDMLIAMELLEMKITDRQRAYFR